MTYKSSRRFPSGLAMAVLLGAGSLSAQTSPVILVSSSALTFKAGLGQNADVQTVFVGSSGAALTLNAAASTVTGGGWLQYSFDSSTTPANLKVMPQTSSLPAGTYQGQIQLSAGAANSPLTISVAVIVGGPGASPLTVTPAVLNFSAQLNGTPPPAQFITVGPAEASVGFTVSASTGSSSAQWLQVTPVSGSTPQVLSVSVNAQGLTAGNYTGTVTILPNAQGSGAVSVVVNLVANALPTLNVSPNQGFQFYFQAGTTAVPPAQGLTLSSTSGALPTTLVPTTGNGLPWLVVGQSQANLGTTLVQIPITISPIVATFQPGTYIGSITITAAGATNPSVVVPVSLQVSTLPLLTLGNSLMPFSFRAGLAPPPQQTVQIAVSSGQLPYSATAVLQPGQAWLTVTPDAGTLPASLNVAVDATGLSSGTYSGSVRVDSPGAANNPLILAVTLSVSANGLIVVSPTEVDFNFQIGMATPAPQTLNIGTTGGTTTFNLQTLTNNCGAFWLSATPPSGTAPTTAKVSINPAGLATPGLCTGRVGIVNQTGAQTLVPVNLTVSADPLLNVTPSLMTFISQANGSAPATQSIQLTSTDPNTPIFYSTQLSTSSGGNWLTIATNATGQTPAGLQIVANQGTLAPGSYSGTVDIRPTGLAPIHVAVTLVVTSNISIGVSTPSITFTTAAGTSPGPQILNISSQGGPVPFAATAVSGLNWLSVTPASGLTPAQLIVSSNSMGLGPATYVGSISITSNQASNASLTVPVTMVVGQSQFLTVAPMLLTFDSMMGDAAGPAAQTIILAPSNGTVDFTAVVQVNGSTPWLKVAPASGTAPSGITVTVDPTDLAPAQYSGTVTITPIGLPQAIVTVLYNLAGPPVPALTSILGAASLLDGTIAPGEIVVIKGANTGAAGEPVVAQLNADGSLPTLIGDTQVLFDTVLAPILSVSGSQVTVVVPYEVTGQASTLVQLKRKSVASNLLQIPVAATVPGVFTSIIPTTRIGVILNADGTPNSATNPAVANTQLTVYYTGDGQTNPPTATNSVTPASPPYAVPVLNLTATIGGVNAPVITFGPMPGMFAGVSTAAVTVPTGLGAGPQPLFLLSDVVPSQGGLFVYVSN